MSKRIGVVLVFSEGTEKVIAQALVDKLVRDGLVDGKRFNVQVEVFDPDKEGSPVWYKFCEDERSVI